MLTTRRAKEISTSSMMANVTCNGVPIYIQHVDENNETARIFPLEEPENEQEISLMNLREH